MKSIVLTVGLVMSAWHTCWATTLGPMIFEITSCSDNLPSCQWIVAKGEIQQDTSRVFQEFLSTHALPSPLPMVVLHSGGGNVLGALALGETFRNAGVTTAVGKSVKAEDEQTGHSFWYITEGACYSACLYSFMGGVHRLITPKGIRPSRLGIHALYLDPDPSVYECTNQYGRWRKELADLLEQYTEQMGVNPAIVQWSEAYAVPDKVKLLSPQEITSLGLLSGSNLNLVF